jgi:hypothetical protein
MSDAQSRGGVVHFENQRALIVRSNGNAPKIKGSRLLSRDRPVVRSAGKAIGLTPTTDC